MSALRQVAVCVPVRDEAALLPQLLAALAAQEVAAEVRVTVCFAFDACTDESEAIVAAAAGKLPHAVRSSTLPPAAPNAGRARRAALALGEAAGPGAALLTTDADSVPARTWIATNLRALDIADVVAGRIERDHVFSDAMQDRLERYYDALYALRRTIDPVPWEAAFTHHYTAGASLAFRADAYAALGGFAERRSGEDALIVDEAHRAGLRVRHDAAVRVETSSRRTGRAVGGLADHLRLLADRPARDAIRVSHPERAAWQYAAHAVARAAFGGLDEATVGRVATTIARDPAGVRETAAASPNAEAFAMRVVPGHPGGERLIGLDEAERALARLVGAACKRAA